jgi:hypothetical protein
MQDEDTIKILKIVYLKCFRRNLTDKNSIQEEIKIRLKSGNDWYHSVPNILSFTLLSKNTSIEIYRNIILSVVLWGCKTWSIIERGS